MQDDQRIPAAKGKRKVSPKSSVTRSRATGGEGDREIHVGDVLDSLAMEIALVSETGEIIVANEAWKRFARENGGADYIGHNYLAVCETKGGAFADSDAERASRGIRAVLEGAVESFEMEYPCHTACEQRWFNMRVSRLRGPHRGAMVVHERITERKQAQEALRLFRNLVDQSVDTFEVVDPETGQFLDVNDKGCTELGYSRAEYLSLRVFDVDPLNTEANWPEVVARIREAGFINRQDLYRRRKDGSTFPIELNAKYVRFDRDYIVAVVRDVTERQEAEEQVREQAAMLDLAHDAIIVRSFKDHRISFWSRGAEKLYGWTVAEALGRDLSTLICVDPSVPDAIRDALAAANEWRGENRHKTRDGKHLIVNTRATLVRDAEGNPKSVLAINIDVTEQKQLEARYLRAQRMQSIGVLASGVAHDLGNILLPIEICAPLLRQDLGAKKRDEIISTIEMSAGRGVGIVKQILAFGRGVEGERQPLQIKELVKDLVNILHETFPKNLKIECVFEAGLSLVMGDSTQLLQVLLNLCMNARDAMPDGGILRLHGAELEVDAGYSTMHFDVIPGRYVKIEVEDTGAGISPEILEYMFEPFFTTKGYGQGTGLGLSTVLGIVRSHGGFVNVKTRLREGTTFQVCLPTSEARLPVVVDPPSPPPPQGHGELVLVVDDEKGVRSAAQLGIESGGYRVLLASGGLEAVELFVARRDEIALVITDLCMPSLDGAGLIRVLRGLAPDIPIIIATGVEGKMINSEFEAMRIETILYKPFGANTLLRAIGEALHPK